MICSSYITLEMVKLINLMSKFVKFLLIAMMLFKICCRNDITRHHLCCFLNPASQLSFFKKIFDIFPFVVGPYICTDRNFNLLLVMKNLNQDV